MISRCPAPPSGKDTAGFSMVEVIVAIVILAVGVLGMAGTTAYVIRQVTLADVMTERAAAVQTTIERVMATDFESVSSGSGTVGIFSVGWTVLADGAQTKIITIVTSGPGLDDGQGFPMLAPMVADTFEYRVIRGG